MRLVVPVAILALVLVAAPGCRSRITGNEGNLEFSYVADDAIRDFNKPIAVGAKLELRVREAGTRRAVELETAQTDDPAVLDVVSFSGDDLVLEGTGHGSAEVQVTARVPSGEVLPDAVNMLARVPEVLKLRHTCTDGPEGRYLVDQDVLVPFDMEMANGQPVIGYGYHPVDLHPADGAALDVTTKDQQYLHLRTRATPGTVVVGSQLDDTTLTLVLLEKTNLDGAQLGPGNEGPARVGHSRLYHVLPTAGGEPVCQAVTPMTASPDTPDICSVEAVDPSDPEAINEHGWIRVQALGEGTCTFTVTFTEGTGATAQLSVEVVPA